MYLKNLIETFSSIIQDPSLFSAARILPNSFTRENGKMPLHHLLVYLIFRHGKSLSEDICTIYSSLNNLNPPSKQAVLKRMSILNYDVWHNIQQLFLQRIYQPMTKDTLKGYLLIAIDGTFATLPKHPALEHFFGKHKSYNGGNTPPQARISIAYDVLNHTILDFQVTHQNVSEMSLMFQHLENLESFLKEYKVIILADRYYGSAELFKYCEMKGYKYIVRAKSNFFRKQRASLNENDANLDIFIDKNWQKRIKREKIRIYIEKNPLMKVRLIKSHYEYEEEYLNLHGKKVIKPISSDSEYFTNLTKEEFDCKQIIQIYHVNRWDVETGYNTIKVLLEFEQLNSCNPIVVMNELMAKIIYFNIENIIRTIADNENSEDELHLVNNKHVIELCHGSWFINGFFRAKFKTKELKELTKECARVKILVRPGRHYKRWDKFRVSIKQVRHRIDGRKNPPLKITKAGIMTSNN